jgi:hypothetical protein
VETVGREGSAATAAMALSMLLVVAGDGRDRHHRRTSGIATVRPCSRRWKILDVVAQRLGLVEHVRRRRRSGIA